MLPGCQGCYFPCTLLAAAEREGLWGPWYCFAVAQFQLQTPRILTNFTLDGTTKIIKMI